MLTTGVTLNPKNHITALRERISPIYKMSWLSLQRRSDASDSEIDEPTAKDNRSDVDLKLDQASIALGRYFSRLDRQVVELTQLFQKNWFLSFLATGSSLKASAFGNIDIDEEREALTAIFEKFNMTKENYSSRLERHLSLASKAKDQVSHGGGVAFKDYLVLFDVTRLHNLVEQWQELQDRQTAIYGPKSDFIETTSQMLFRKHTHVNKSNQLCVSDMSELPIPLPALSSGEKQLLIFLSETLLQEQETYIFLADEPELSLHVEWQEELVPNILKINRNAQILFATHSPDIVNIYQNNVFRMEELID